jgi:ribonuclease D
MNRIEVTDPGKNDALISILTDADRVAIDTEFMREKTYYAQLCLVQIATATEIFCADPLTGTDLSHFWPALNSCNWVLHSGRQDIEVFYQSNEQMPASVFDTQIAAGLLGYAPQMGYATLVKELFGKELPKAHTRADWTRRPLSAEMLEYAAEDVEYLLDAADQLSVRLSELGRLDWANEDSARLLEPGLYSECPANAIGRVKGAGKLTGRARNAATALAAWREQRAVQRNRPRQWILRDAVLIELALTNPQNKSALASISGMPASTAQRSSTELLEVLAGATGGNESYVPPARPNEQQKLLLKTMQAEVAKTATDLGIAAELIAPRKELSAVMLGERQSRVFSGWRLEAIGRRLLELL